MKYRRLDKEELQELEQEFIRFLAANTVTADDWQKLKKEQPEKAEDLIDVFSDVVFEKTLSKIQYLQHRSTKDLKVFRCGEEKIELLGMRIAGDTQLDFTKNQSPQEMIALIQKEPNAKIQLYQAEKNYKGERNRELFEMLENGCLIDNENIFKMLESLKQ